MENDCKRQDVVYAVRQDISCEGIQNCWGKPDPLLYLEWHDLLNEGDVEISNYSSIAKIRGVPDDVVSVACKSSNSIDEYIFEVLKGDRRVQDLRNMLKEGP